jgi:hypothetical protein
MHAVEGVEAGISLQHYRSHWIEICGVFLPAVAPGVHSFDNEMFVVSSSCNRPTWTFGEEVSASLGEVS